MRISKSETNPNFRKPNDPIQTEKFTDEKCFANNLNVAMICLKHSNLFRISIFAFRISSVYTTPYANIASATFTKPAMLAPAT